MSRIADELYFAPQIAFADVDLTGVRLPDQFRQRMAGFYLKPAIALAERNEAFAAGLLVVCAIDALALIMTSSNSVSGRIAAFCRKITDLADADTADIFCSDFRHGLVHQARVKNGSEFSSDLGRVAVRYGNRLCVNPLLLAKAVLELLDGYVEDLHRNPADKAILLKRIKRKFNYELNN